MFHVSQLKAFTPDHTPVFSDVLKLVDLLASSTEPECILDRRLVKKGNTAIPQVLIKWSHFPAEAATWEDLYVVQQRFPASSAWGQVTPKGGKMSWHSRETRRRRGDHVGGDCVWNFTCSCH